MLKIEIYVPDHCEDPVKYMHAAMASIGYAPAKTRELVGVLGRMADAVKDLPNKQPEDVVDAGPLGSTQFGTSTDMLTGVVEEPKAEAEKPKGKPGRPKKVVETPKTEDPPAVQVQDAADEKIEADANRTTPDATLDDVRQAMMSYVEKFGMPAASEDGPKIFEKALGEAHLVDGKPYVDAKGAACVDATGKPYWTMGQLKTPEQFGKAQAYWAAAASENPFDREPVKKG